MKKTISHYLLIVFSLFLLTSCEKNVDWKKESNLFKIKRPENILLYEGEPFTGVIENYKNKLNMKQGGPSGKFTKTSKVSSWKEGLPHGYWESIIHKNGFVEKMTYEKGVVVGTYELFNKDGEILEKVEWNNGKFSGERIELDNVHMGGTKIPNFQIIKTKTLYVNSERHGIMESYYPNGSIGMRVKFKDGRPISDVIVFYLDGKNMFTKKYNNGLLDKIIYFKKDGTPLIQDNIYNTYDDLGLSVIEGHMFQKYRNFLEN